MLVQLHGIHGSGKMAIIDEIDFDRLSQYNWVVHKSGYVVAGHGGKIRMHRLVALTPSGMDTDHINGDLLDNRRSNLRVCTHAENMRNRKAGTNSSSGICGVSRGPTGGWQATLRIHGRSIYLGEYDEIHEAAAVRQAAAREAFGEFYRPIVNMRTA